MFDLIKLRNNLEKAISNNELILLIGSCTVKYFGRAASKLEKGNRLLLIKGDKSFAIHQNKFLRPVNYMMNARIYSNISNNELEVIALKEKPREELRVLFNEVQFFKSFFIEDKVDLRLFGSESELSRQLSEDLSFIEPGLKPCKQEHSIKKGTIDILAEDSKGRIVVIEVKRRKASLDSVSQLNRYKEQIQKIKSRKTRGILLAPEITKNAKDLLHSYDLEYFKFDFEIGNPSAKIKGLHKKQTKLSL